VVAVVGDIEVSSAVERQAYRIHDGGERWAAIAIATFDCGLTNHGRDDALAARKKGNG
jgi:hypothetical protein